MLSMLGRRAAAWIGARSPWTSAYGLARTVLALGLLGTLLANDTSLLFHPVAGAPPPPSCGGIGTIALFCRLPGSLELARWIAIGVLVLVASGWRPRVTGVLHWYVAWSFPATASVVDGGDQISAVLALLLIPVTLCDPRRWHWDPMPIQRARDRAVTRLVAFVAFLVIRVQVAGIYFDAAVSKFAVPEWADGTAIYYIFTDPAFGHGMKLAPLLQSSWIVAALTWGTLVFEAVLFAGLFMERRYRRPLLFAGIAFHAGIIVAHGLISFFFSMSAALLLYLHPMDQPLAAVEKMWSRLRARLSSRFSMRAPKRAAAAAALTILPGCYEGLGDDREDPRCYEIADLAQDAVREGVAPGAMISVQTAHGRCDVAAGQANLDGDLVDVGDAFRVGSITKTFVALAVRDLADEGLLSLDDPVADHLPDLKPPPGVTIRHLLDHTSGLPDYVTLDAYLLTSITTPGRLWEPAELMQIAFAGGGIRDPGTEYRYSSTGYIALGMILERVAGARLDEVLDERVLEPRGLSSTTLAVDVARPGVISGWEDRDEVGNRSDVAGLLHPSGTWAAGALVSTAPDLVTFMRSLDEDDGSLAEWTADPVATGQERYPHYAAGLLSRGGLDGECWGHDGRMPGYSALAMHCPESDATIAVLLNTNSADLDLVFDITAFILDG